MKCQPLVDWWLRAGNQPANYRQLHPGAWRFYGSNCSTATLPLIIMVQWEHGPIVKATAFVLRTFNSTFMMGGRVVRNLTDPKWPYLKGSSPFPSLSSSFSVAMLFLAFGGEKPFPKPDNLHNLQETPKVIHCLDALTHLIQSFLPGSSRIGGVGGNSFLGFLGKKSRLIRGWRLSFKKKTPWNLTRCLLSWVSSNPNN